MTSLMDGTPNHDNNFPHAVVGVVVVVVAGVVVVVVAGVVVVVVAGVVVAGVGERTVPDGVESDSDGVSSTRRWWS